MCGVTARAADWWPFLGTENHDWSCVSPAAKCFYTSGAIGGSDELDAWLSQVMLKISSRKC